jgi:hypothetical protein
VLVDKVSDAVRVAGETFEAAAGVDMGGRLQNA